MRYSRTGLNNLGPYPLALTLTCQRIVVQHFTLRGLDPLWRKEYDEVDELAIAIGRKGIEI